MHRLDLQVVDNLTGSFYIYHYSIFRDGPSELISLNVTLWNGSSLALYPSFSPSRDWYNATLINSFLNLSLYSPVYSVDSTLTISGDISSLPIVINAGGLQIVQVNITHSNTSNISSSLSLQLHVNSKPVHAYILNFDTSQMPSSSSSPSSHGSQSPNTASDQSSTSRPIIVLAAVLAILVVLVASFIVYRRWKKNHQPISNYQPLSAPLNA